MAEYSILNRGKLKLKGEESGIKKKIKKKKHCPPCEVISPNEDSISHGGWWEINSFADIKGQIALELLPHCYMKALDDGLLILGAPHSPGEGPTPEEVITAIPIDLNRVAFKTGYNKYLGVDSAGMVVARADAIGQLEYWEPVFQNGKTALLAANQKFVSVDDEDNLCALSSKAEEKEMLHIRSQGVKVDIPKDEGPDEESGTASQIEINYVKKFQKFQDKKMRICQDAVENVHRARHEGNLHEILLDRREKMKSDRYCK